MHTMFKASAGAALLTFAAITSAAAAESKRTELKRTDLTGTNMEMITSYVTAEPGDTITRHSHHGEEAAYILEGATIEFPDGRQVTLEPGTVTR